MKEIFSEAIYSQDKIYLVYIFMVVTALNIAYIQH